jgi:phage tail sheath protein FI
VHQVQLVSCPETDDPTFVTEALTYCENRGDCMFVGHTPQGLDADAAKAWVKTENLRGDKRYGALYFPWIRVRDPIGTQKWLPPTGHIMGVYARTERERGIWKAPAGNAARVNGALDVEHHITDAVHTDLVKNGSVNAVRAVPNVGIVIDSSRTLSTSPIWLYVNVRLLFNFVKSSLMNGLRWVVQEPNDQTLWNKVKFNSVVPFLMGLWRRGAFGSGAPEDVFTVKIDEENNPPASIQQGILNIEVYFYPSRLAETIVMTGRYAAPGMGLIALAGAVEHKLDQQKEC